MEYPSMKENILTIKNIPLGEHKESFNTLMLIC